MMIVTETVRDQRLMALETAQKIRIDGAATRRRVASLPSADGRALVAALLESPTPDVLSMRVGALLKSIRRVGYSKVSAWIGGAGVKTADRRIHELSDRQRHSLADALRCYRGSVQ